VAVSPIGGPEGLWTGNQSQFPDIGGYGNHEYGNRVGIFRMLSVLDKYGITPTMALDKSVADHYPILIEEGRKRGAEFVAHGLSRRRIIHIGSEMNRKLALHHLGCLQRGRRGRHGGRRRSSRQVGLLAPG
jgi:peptidoglycan/xylan/chitin deacetylase (PgdA/CDA1 family)